MASDYDFKSNETQYIIYGLTTIFLNIVIYATISLVRDFRNPLGTLAKCLTFADILIGAVFVIDGIVVVVDMTPDLATCSVLSYVLNLSFGITTTLFGCISYDRYTAIISPDRYPMTKRATYNLARIVCVGNGALFLPSLLGWGVDNSTPYPSCIRHWEEYSATSFFFISTLMVTNMFVSAICYFQILDACIKQYHDRLGSKPRYYGPNTTYPILTNDHGKLTAKVFLGILILFYITWMPFMLVTYINLATDLWIPPLLYKIFLNIGLSMGFVKFAIYVVFLPSFRRGLFGTCCLCASNCLDYIADTLDNYNTDDWEDFTINSTMSHYRSI